MQRNDRRNPAFWKVELMVAKDFALGKSLHLEGVGQRGGRGVLRSLGFTRGFGAGRWCAESKKRRRQQQRAKETALRHSFRDSAFLAFFHSRNHISACASWVEVIVLASVFLRFFASS